MANAGSTAETICSAPAREKEEAIFYLCFSAFPAEVEKSFERTESPSLCLCEAKVAVALLFDSSAWALYFLSCSFNLGTSLCQCLSIPLSNGAAEGTEWALKPRSVACSGWGSPAILIPWHTGQLLLPAALARPSAVLGLGFEEQPHPLPPSFMQRWCRTEPFHALPVSGCSHRDAQHTSCGRANNELHLEFYVNY